MAMRQSVAAIDELAASARESEGTLRIDASNLILLLQGKVYEDYACNSVWETLSVASLTEIQNAVRNRILELTIQIEKSIPAAADIDVGPPTATAKNPEKVTQITNQVINGNVTSISNVGDGAQFSFNIEEGDNDAFVKALVKSGIAKQDAQELAKIMASEKGGSEAEPFGTKAKVWIVANIGKAANGTWKAGMAVATKVLTEAALKYYGFK
jgi:hypothetical protein